MCTCMFHSRAWTSITFGYLQANVNIPGISESTIRWKIQKMDFTADAQIHVYIITVFLNLFTSNNIYKSLFYVQKAALYCAATSSPDAHWWIKADGCDITRGLTESQKGKWGGDVDLCDGHLQALYSEYQSVLQESDTLGQIEPLTVQVVLTQLENVRGTILQEISFIVQGE